MICGGSCWRGIVSGSFLESLSGKALRSFVETCDEVVERCVGNKSARTDCHTAQLARVDQFLHILGAAESSESPLISQMPDMTTSRAFRTTGRLAFEQAGITHADVDHLMAYDAFAHLPIYALEDLGFVGRGEGIAAEAVALVAEQ